MVSQNFLYESKLDANTPSPLTVDHREYPPLIHFNASTSTLDGMFANISSEKSPVNGDKAVAVTD